MTDRQPVVDRPAAAVIPTPRQVAIALTGRCNLHCAYCFYAGEMAARADLPTPAWLAAFEQLGRLGVMSATLTGGEVFTRRDLFALLDGLIAQRMRYSLLTNGTLIDEHTLAQFNGKRRTRLDLIQVSLDGATPEIHDQSRPHSFTRALHGLRLLIAAGFPVTVRVTINRHNLDDLDNLAHLLLDELGLPGFSTNAAMPVGAGCRPSEGAGLTPAQTAQAMRSLERLHARYPGRLQASAGPQVLAKMYAQMETARRTGQPAPDWRMGYLSACGCVFSQIDILHDGSIVPCHMLPGVVLGNITHDDLGEIWRTHPSLHALRARGEITLASVPGCAGCEWAAQCNGGCPGLAHQLTGDFNRANPADCYRRFLAGQEV